jgi:hypothetical protein
MFKLIAKIISLVLITIVLSFEAGHVVDHIHESEHAQSSSHSIEKNIPLLDLTEIKPLESFHSHAEHGHLVLLRKFDEKNFSDKVTSSYQNLVVSVQKHLLISAKKTLYQRKQFLSKYSYIYKVPSSFRSKLLII